MESEKFAQLVATRTEHDLDPVRSLCVVCAEVLHVTGAGLMLASGKRSLGCVGVSDQVTEAVEQVEYTLGEGPCVAAFRTEMPVFDPDLTDEHNDRWPIFRTGALAAGIRATFGFPLLIDWVCIGAMNLYRDRPGALTAGQVRDALVVATIVSHTLLAWQSQAAPGTVAWQLERIPNHRVELHQATGRIAVQAGISVADALVLLRAYAFSRDRAIRDVAADVASGLLRLD